MLKLRLLALVGKSQYPHLSGIKVFLEICQALVRYQQLV